MARSTKTATETASEASVANSISVPIQDAEQLYELFKNVELADFHFHTCQAVNFRQHVQSVYKAENVRAAFERLNDAITAAKGG